MIINQLVNEDYEERSTRQSTNRAPKRHFCQLRKKILRCINSLRANLAQRGEMMKWTADTGGGNAKADGKFARTLEMDSKAASLERATAALHGEDDGALTPRPNEKGDPKAALAGMRARF
jgi:hypothetical protein